MKYLFSKNKIVKNKIETPVKHHISRATKKIPKKGFRNYTTNGFYIKEVNKVNDILSDRYGYFPHL